MLAPCHSAALETRAFLTSHWEFVGVRGGVGPLLLKLLGLKPRTNGGAHLTYQGQPGCQVLPVSFSPYLLQVWLEFPALYPELSRPVARLH